MTGMIIYIYNAQRRKKMERILLSLFVACSIFIGEIPSAKAGAASAAMKKFCTWAGTGQPPECIKACEKNDLKTMSWCMKKSIQAGEVPDSLLNVMKSECEDGCIGLLCGHFKPTAKACATMCCAIDPSLVKNCLKHLNKNATCENFWNY
jgi:hypothetical protein